MAVTLLLAGGLVAGIRLLRPPQLALVGGQVYLGKDATEHTIVHRAGAFCAAAPSSSDRVPDLAAGPQVHVIYAYPADGVDHYAAMGPAIASDLAAVDRWWRAQDATRTVRFDLYAFPGCSAGLDELDLTRVQLAQPASYYSPIDSRASRMINELNKTFYDPSKKYLVYYDGPGDEPRLCGQSTVFPDQGGAYSYSLIYARACHADIGSGAITASVAAHELGHNLGAVPPNGPPHGCPGDPAHVCDDENDLMFPYTRGQGLGAVALDANHDDYYGHGGSWWDLQDSPWLVHIGSQAALNVSLTGTGSGLVSSDLPGISCPASCTATWDIGSRVELSASPAAKSRFAGWTGACTADPCIVTMSSAQSITARFEAQDSLTVAVRGAGRVVSRPAGISCPGHCTASYDRGTRIQLLASAARNQAFGGWTGDCSGKTGCVVPAGSSVAATFRQAQAFKPPRKKK